MTDTEWYWRQAMEYRFGWHAPHRVMRGYRMPVPESSVRQCAARTLRKLRLLRSKR